MSNPSTIWAQLAMPNPPAGSVPYVLPDGVTISTDVLNLSYSSILQALTVTNGIIPDSQINQAGLASPVTVNYVMGEVTLKAGTSAVVVNCNKVISGAFVFLQRRNTDATAVQLGYSATTNGQFTIVSNANATADVNINFYVINTNVQTT